MPYTFGAVHSFLTGTGSFAVAAPTGLLLTLTTIPASADLEFGSPARYRGLGDITLRDAMGWLPSVDLVVSPQLELHLAVVPTQLAYNLRAGVVLEVRELLGGNVPNNQLQPWDRNPSLVNMSYAADSAPAGGYVTMWTYTVPAAKRLWVASWLLTTMRYTAATTLGNSYLRATIGGSAAMIVVLRSNVIGVRESAQLGAAQLILPAGTVLVCERQSGDTGGTVQNEAHMNGFLFDA